jgi:hypothetical protein
MALAGYITMNQKAESVAAPAALNILAVKPPDPSTELHVAMPMATVAVIAVSECATTIGFGGLHELAVLNEPAGKSTR